MLVDSIQTLRSERVESAPGSVAQVRECAALLAATAKSHGTALVLVGHVTKEGAIAGPRVLEHLVDVVLTLRGRPRSTRSACCARTRTASARRRRSASSTMGGSGLEAVPNPSELFLAERRAGAPGIVRRAVARGHAADAASRSRRSSRRPATARRAAPRSASTTRALALLLAVLDRRAHVDLLSARRLRERSTAACAIREPGADLALALALASSRLDLALPPDAAACGEVGLGGEIRRVARLDVRVAEAARLGFRQLLVPAGAQRAR